MPDHIHPQPQNVVGGIEVGAEETNIVGGVVVGAEDKHVKTSGKSFTSNHVGGEQERRYLIHSGHTSQCESTNGGGIGSSGEFLDTDMDTIRLSFPEFLALITAVIVMKVRFCFICWQDSAFHTCCQSCSFASNLCFLMLRGIGFILIDISVRSPQNLFIVI